MSWNIGRSCGEIRFSFDVDVLTRLLNECLVKGKRNLWQRWKRHWMMNDYIQKFKIKTYMFELVLFISIALMGLKCKSKEVLTNGICRTR